MKRLTGLALFLLISSPAGAFKDPGPPPWSCHAYQACNGEKNCVAIIGVPLGIGLRAVEAHKKRFILVGYDGKERIAMVYDTLEKARQYIEAARNEERVSVVLISNDEVADAHGFWAHSVYWRGDRKFISAEYLGIACG
ncbi:hypothetical protein [Rhizobium sp. SG_E_25_P2]|uniref:hypothetical protein n=1 Tax=Rhizobium sp. SG_E_25_P2 TaxID=2879942 RepID=UPI0024762346|nr:hypothetical protein [Rhizobium sp. SG_E_25_P2]